MTRDAQGNAVSGGTLASAERLDQAIRAFTIGHGDALALLDAAIALEPHLYFAHHGVMHCLEMTGRPEDGLAWSREHAALWASAASGSQGHLWWHTSLFHVELGQFGEALDVFDGPLARTIRPIGFSRSDPAALLWRLDTYGCDLGRRWHDLLPRWEAHADGRSLICADMHAAMTELRSGNEALALGLADERLAGRPESLINRRFHVEAEQIAS